LTFIRSIPGALLGLSIFISEFISHIVIGLGWSSTITGSANSCSILWSPSAGYKEYVSEICIANRSAFSWLLRAQGLGGAVYWRIADATGSGLRSFLMDLQIEDWR
jgi:hypothetical protein